MTCSGHTGSVVLDSIYEAPTVDQAGCGRCCMYKDEKENSLKEFMFC